jgi:transcriptional regulator with XRE-family HTH domain
MGGSVMKSSRLRGEEDVSQGERRLGAATVLPGVSMLDGIENLGQLMYYVREAHRKSRSYVSESSGVSLSQISRLESTGYMGTDSFREYVAALDLDYDQRSLLMEDLYPRFRKPSRIRQDEEMFNQVRLGSLKGSELNRYPELRRSLEAESLPCYVRDELWFVHAYNRSMLNLFELTVEDLSNNWAMWHVVASRFYPRSKFALAHGRFAHLYYPQSLKHFFDHTARFFFTRHMRALRNRLWNLGSRQYRQWWTSVTSLNTPYAEAESPPRMIDFNGRLYLAKSSDDQFSINMEDGCKLNYFKVTWEGMTSPATKSLRSLAERNQDTVPPVLYASDYVDDYNSWGELSG